MSPDYNKRTVCYCQRLINHEQQPYFAHFFPHPGCCKMCGDEPIFKVLVEETQETPDCYWAWWDEHDLEFQFIGYWKGAVEICFPYGTKVEEAAGKGKLLPVKVTLQEST